MTAADANPPEPRVAERQLPLLAIERPAARFALVGVGALGVGVAGLAGFVAYTELGEPTEVGAGLFAVAAAAGAAAFFSPCSFGLLLTMLARPLDPTDQPRRRWVSALGPAAGIALGAALFLTLFATVVAIVGDAVFSGIGFTTAPGRVLRVGIGALLILLGLVQIGRIEVSLRGLEPATAAYLGRQVQPGRRRHGAGSVLFGFVYLLAGFG